MSLNKVRIIHVEDEKDAQVSFRKVIELFIENAEIVGTAATLADGLKIINQIEFDLLFLDLNLSDGDGFFIVEKRPEIAQKVVLTTANETYGIRGVKAGVLDYILKPYTIADVQGAVNRVYQPSKDIAKKEVLNEKIQLPDMEGVQLVDLNEIVRIESDRNYAKVILNNGEKKYVSRTLKAFEESLESKGFIRVHQSHLVNSAYIVRVNKSDRGSVELSNSDIIKCSLSGKRALKNALGI